MKPVTKPEMANPKNIETIFKSEIANVEKFETEKIETVFK